MLPGISCLVPTTADRIWCLPLAIKWWERQTHDGPLELVVVTEDADVIAPLLPRCDDIVLESVARGLTLGAKHNVAAAIARHQWLAKWDDDDWQSPVRLEMTLRTALRVNAEMVSAAPLLHHELDTGRTWEFCYGLREPWQPGNSLLFSREMWGRVGFDNNRSSGIDSDFIMRALKDGVTGVTIDDMPLTVCMRHGQTTGLKVWNPKPPEWLPWNGDFTGLLGADLDLFDKAFKHRP